MSTITLSVECHLHNDETNTPHLLNSYEKNFKKFQKSLDVKSVALAHMIEFVAKTAFCCYILPRDGAIVPTIDGRGRLSQAVLPPSVPTVSVESSEKIDGYGTYAFGYDIEDPDTNNVQFRSEEKLSNGSVVGRYGFLDPEGVAFIINYIADEGGYRANVENTVRLSYLKPIKIETEHRNEKYVIEEISASDEPIESKDVSAD